MVSIVYYVGDQMNVVKEMKQIDDIMLSLSSRIKYPNLSEAELDGLYVAIHELREAKLSLKIVNNY
jgi:hypothetical protein